VVLYRTYADMNRFLSALEELGVRYGDVRGLCMEDLVRERYGIDLRELSCYEVAKLGLSIRAELAREDAVYICFERGRCPCGLGRVYKLDLRPGKEAELLLKAVERIVALEEKLASSPGAHPRS